MTTFHYPHLNEELAEGYNSSTQRVRVMSEGWVQDNIFCPSCDAKHLKQFENNRPVADFYCAECGEEFELKSNRSKIRKKIPGGAYASMIERLESEARPNLMLLAYDPDLLEVRELVVVPKQFLVPTIVEKRKPLKDTARRAGWVGCNIHLESIPETGRIPYIFEGKAVPPNEVRAQWGKTLFIRNADSAETKGWLIDVMRSVDKLGDGEFTLQQVYEFAPELATLHPDNNHVEAKIRQTLQRLRDNGYIEFVGRGVYRRV